LADVAFGAKLKFKDLFQFIVREMARIAAQRFFLLLLSSFGSPAGAGVAVGSQLVMQHGGEVRGGMPGLDSVFAALTPGEIVLPRSRAEDFDAIAELARERRTQGLAGRQEGPALHAAFQILPRRDDRDLADIIEGITRLVERRGYRLVASEVRS